VILCAKASDHREDALQLNDDRPARRILCRIAHIGQQLPGRKLGNHSSIPVVDQPEVSNSDQLMLGIRAIMMAETSIFSLFQVL